MPTQVPALLLPAVAAGFLGLAAQPASAALDRDCRDFTYQEDAQAVYDQDPKDPNRLDADNDGVACENLPRRGGATSTPDPTPTADSTPTTDPTPPGGTPPAALPSGGVDAGAGGMAGPASLPVVAATAATFAVVLLATGAVVAVRRRSG